MIFENFGAAGRANASRGEDVLDADWDSGERWKRFAGGNEGVDLVGLGVCAFGRKSEIGIECGILRVNAGEKVGGEFACGDFFGGEGGTDGGNGPISHRSMTLGTRK